MAKERGWHCAFTRACLFETLSEPQRVPGTYLVCCRPHAAQMQQQRFRGGQESAEALAGMARASVPREGKP
jgi:hypothetical protein